MTDGKLINHIIINCYKLHILLANIHVSTNIISKSTTGVVIYFYVSNLIIFTNFTAMLNAEVDDVIWTILQNGVLHCEMYGYLRGEIDWLKDGQQVQSGGRYNITVGAGSREGQDGGESSVSSVVSQLTIQQVEQRDEGTYTCTAVGTSLQERIYAL